jgi:hypothetical protein
VTFSTLRTNSIIGMVVNISLSRVTSTGSVTAPTGFNKVDILLVGGGQAGTNTGRGSAGGKGGFVYQTNNISCAAGTTLTCTVGGAGAVQGGNGTASTVAISGGGTYSSASGSQSSAGAIGQLGTAYFAGTFYAGGGGNGVFDSDGGTTAGWDGGGTGVYHTSVGPSTKATGTAGHANTGGGGGGGAYSQATGYAGGTGVILLAFHN